MQFVPHGEPIVNWWKWRPQVAKFVTETSTATKFAKFVINASVLQPIQVAQLKSILYYSSWKIYSSYGLNTLGPLCLWQCFAVYVSIVSLNRETLLVLERERPLRDTIVSGERP